MSTHKSPGDNARKVWNHEFTWTDKHFTPEELLPLRQQTDDLAVDAVSRLQAVAVKNKKSNTGQCFGRFDMYSVLKEHYGEDIVLQELWEEVNAVPEWVDWAQIERGQEFLYRYLIPNLTGLALQGFLGGTATVAGGTEVLVRTGGFSIRVFTHQPQLNKFTKRETKADINLSRFRPVETIGFAVFLFECLLYTLVLGMLANVLRANGMVSRTLLNVLG